MGERQENILKAIVEAYIKTAKPIGSKSLCKRFKCSSATIRNEMGELENLGLLEKIISRLEGYLVKKVINIMYNI